MKHAAVGAAPGRGDAVARLRDRDEEAVSRALALPRLGRDARGAEHAELVATEAREDDLAIGGDDPKAPIATVRADVERALFVGAPREDRDGVRGDRSVRATAATRDGHARKLASPTLASVNLR